MKQKATLLIINIAKLYTMEYVQDDKMNILSNAFLAVHHDHIMMIGVGNYETYIDSDTRIINAKNGIVVPGFLDISFAPYPLLSPWLFEQQVIYEDYYKENRLALTRDMNSLLFQSLRNGITTFAYPVIPKLYEEVLLSLKKEWIEFYKNEDKNTQCFSCFYHPQAHPCIDPLYQARLLIQDGHTPIDVLQTMTSMPANYLHLSHLGSLKVGKQADILLFEGESIEYVFHQVSQNCLRSVIKKGTQQFPYILI